MNLEKKSGKIRAQKFIRCKGGETEETIPLGGGRELRRVHDMGIWL
jgi:hypothetical protein